ncbi:hypothetical protein EI94DRAFT_1734316 [Lactarius quietus]|nr:hypothetical protein EI94DRAFT_1734316 [Lactarius quietus]
MHNLSPISKQKARAVEGLLGPCFLEDTLETATVPSTQVPIHPSQRGGKSCGFRSQLLLPQQHLPSDQGDRLRHISLRSPQPQPQPRHLRLHLSPKPSPTVHGPSQGSAICIPSKNRQLPLPSDRIHTRTTNHTNLQPHCRPPTSPNASLYWCHHRHDAT